MDVWTVTAFADQPSSGNIAAVAIVDEFPSDEACLKVAAAMNFSETAFLKNLHQNHFHIRWFTPKVEVKLCGHATLASAHLLHQEKLVTEESIVFESLSGLLTVCSSFENYILDFPLQKIEEQVDLSLIKHDFGEVINAARACDDIIIELSSEEQVRNYIPDFSKIEKINYRAVILTAKGSSPYDFVSRFFAPRVGINEDAVTGSAHCKLADYYRQRLNKLEFTAYQASSRGGEMRISIVGDRVYLKGQALVLSKRTIIV